LIAATSNEGFGKENAVEATAIENAPAKSGLAGLLRKPERKAKKMSVEPARGSKRRRAALPKPISFRSATM
jgi:hypothetical protein